MFRRHNRPGDFRDSGSGLLDYDMNLIGENIIKMVFEIASKIKSQSAAFDILMNAEGRPVISEVSYCYQAEAVYNCPGYWDPELRWHPKHVWPQDAILKDMLNREGLDIGFGFE